MFIPLKCEKVFLTLIEILLNTNFIDTWRKGHVNLIKLSHLASVLIPVEHSVPAELLSLCMGLLSPLVGADVRSAPHRL